MLLKFHGGVGTVTGSCTELLDPSTGDRTLVDCGMLVGEVHSDEWNERPLPFDPSQVDRILLTHAHLDHLGLLPRMVDAGFRGRVYATRPTIRLGVTSLRDAVRYQAHPADAVDRISWRELPDPGTRHAHRLGPFDVKCFRTAHLLGAVAIRLTWDGPSGRNTILFSGDIGCNTGSRGWHPVAHPRDEPSPAPSGGYVVMESTYGARIRPADETSAAIRLSELRRHMWDVVRGHGRLVIPAFAMGRTQDLLVDIHVVLARDPELAERIAIYVASPLGVKMSRRFAEVLDRERVEGSPTWLTPCFADWLELPRDLGQRHAVAAGLVAAVLGHAEYAAEVPSSGTAANFRCRWTSAGADDVMRTPCVVIGGNGMGDAGCMGDTLPWVLHEPGSRILLTGYAPPHTPVGRLRDFARRRASGSGAGRKYIEWTTTRYGRVRVYEHEFQAGVVELPGYSGHADQAGLVTWLLGGARPLGDVVFLNHGDDASRTDLELAITVRADDLGIEAPRIELPAAGDVFDLDAAAWLHRPEQDEEAAQ